MRLLDKVAIITGGGRGIGEATAKKFAKEGAKVVIADINNEDVKKTVNEIHENGGVAAGINVDVTNTESVNKMIDFTLKNYGRLDIIVNNAGITMDSTLLKMAEEQWDAVIDVNLKGVYICGQAAAKVMAEQGSGVILNASSVVGLYGNFGQTNYAATKWGVIGMTKTWAKELGKKGVRSNAVAPGFIATPMVKKMPEKVIDIMKGKSPLGILGEPEDIANAYAFLASDEAKFITGSVLEITGGVVL
ncbi:3-oxoacyl-ACP reductase FabG [Sedimentibacter hydroxybenzoicus DSM 7310]|uniref:3-oxoacyl-[acyl-carrier-protein] reductase n=1 Tax=Sedimentibacter hydroxybenzoicus DSM 7310 TaxID=1123245 RepID=A0A974GY11_SEDHY|nr:3-oxoacyl-ACP reductase FabG [Sedimentibacter hydroxybenzoicus]NYB75625.1 3-oxoacyl-ACP reductase FabG [Sedimentibacter hydroxybenzoicus DSM 7310]